MILLLVSVSFFKVSLFWGGGGGGGGVSGFLCNIVKGNSHSIIFPIIIEFLLFDTR